MSTEERQSVKSCIMSCV